MSERESFWEWTNPRNAWNPQSVVWEGAWMFVGKFRHWPEFIAINPKWGASIDRDAFGTIPIIESEHVPQGKVYFKRRQHEPTGQAHQAAPGARQSVLV